MRLWALGLIYLLLTFWLCYFSHQLSGANPNISCDKLEVGDHICLALDEDCTDTQTVEEGDTCQKIADENGVDLPTLLKNNPQIGEPENWTIYPGEVRCVLFPTILSYLYPWCGFRPLESDPNIEPS